MKEIYDKSVTISKSIIKQHTLALIDAEIETVEGMKRKFVTQPAEYKNSDANVWREGYNTALTDHITYLKEQRELIDNS